MNPKIKNELMASLLFMVLMLGFVFTIPKKKEVPVVTDVARYIVAPHVTSLRLIQRNNQRFATGFYLNYFGKSYIMTNKHVCDSSKDLDMGDNIIFGNVVEKIIAIDTIHDLCLVTNSYHVGGLNLAAMDVKPLEKIILVGHPRGLELTVREGRLMGTTTQVVPWITNLEPVRVHQISASAYGGNSGSPVTNEAGEVVGVLFAGIDTFPLEPFVVPHQYLVRFLMEEVLKIKQ